jgi:hypothetical protein
VKSVEEYDRARKRKYTPQQNPEPIAQAHALGGMERTSASLIAVGKKPATATTMSI